MKSVLISINPKWCELIASGKKTIEVRKNSPKIEVPFKCYIYETKARTDMPSFVDEDGHVLYTGRGQVIGEFVCDEVEEFHEWELTPQGKYSDRERERLENFLTASCLSEEELVCYRGDLPYYKPLYGWHISELKIYDKPIELIEFFVWKKCNSCKTSGYESTACMYDEDCKVPAVVTRPPQSWMFVEELQDV